MSRRLYGFWIFLTGGGVRFHNITFGCQMNVGDADWLRLSLEARSWQYVEEDEAEVFLLSTCSVREKPEQKVYSLLGRLQKSYWQKNRRIFVAVGGCVAQQIGEQLWQQFPFVRLVYGTDGLPLVPDALQRLAEDSELRLSFLDFYRTYPERKMSLPTMLPPQAFVNIMQGCDNFCTYCIVPFTRGRQKSRQAAAVVEECRLLVSRGVREITLLGQNVNSFGLDKNADGTTFSQLLRQVAEIDGLMRLKFVSSHPKDIAPDVISAFGELLNLCPQLHLPLQSGSDTVLKAMGRKYTLEKYMQIVHNLREVSPNIALSTDLIVGFPSESEADFEQTLAAVKEIGFESSFSFKYSDRPGTRAEKMTGKIDEVEKSRRLTELQALQAELTEKALAARVGKIDSVLVEGKSRRQGDLLVLPNEMNSKTLWQGRDSGGRIVHFADLRNDLTGKILSVRIIRAGKHSLQAEVEGAVW